MFLSSVLATALSCPPQPVPPQPGPVPPSAPSSHEQMELAATLNQSRAGQGLPWLAQTADLGCAAQRHAEDVARIRSCTHTGSDGSTPWDRGRRCGTATSGEIIACGFADARSAVRGWENSPAHRAIMWDRGQTAMGVGVAKGYYVVVFRK